MKRRGWTEPVPTFARPIEALQAYGEALVTTSTAVRKQVAHIMDRRRIARRARVLAIGAAYSLAQEQWTAKVWRCAAVDCAVGCPGDCCVLFSSCASRDVAPSS
jgi:hypothetical protein